MNSPNPAGSPRVSVVAIFLNGDAFLEEAVDSVLAQTFQDFELILVDDGSTDRSPEISARYVAERPGQVIYIDHPEHRNLGMSASRNAGVRVARGELLAFIDADDVWLPEKLAEQVALFDAHPDVGLVAGATCNWSSWNGGSDEFVLIGHRQNELIPAPEALCYVYPLGRAQAPCPSNFAVRRSAFERVNGFEADYRGPLQMYEDQAFLSKIYASSAVLFSDHTWVRYRLHDASCMAVNVRAGNYSRVRGHFLKWLEAYLLRGGGPDRAVRAALRRAKWAHRHPRLSDALQRGADEARWRWRAFKRRVRRRLFPA
jgi:glycosyltransferase involved in cell wall biosynthesis